MFKRNKQKLHFQVKSFSFSNNQIMNHFLYLIKIYYLHTPKLNKRIVHLQKIQITELHEDVEVFFIFVFLFLNFLLKYLIFQSINNNLFYYFHCIQ